MPVAPTYPGVYIEEVPSGVHTITGVSTSTAAFVGYTARGPVDKAVHIFSFGDFERAFGGLSIDSRVSYAVKHFFQNGGTEAYMVRVANSPAPAAASLGNTIAAGGVPVLNASAASAGTWGNNLELDVDYDTDSPNSRFNLTVTEIVERNGQRTPDRVEIFRNLSMNSFDSNYAVDTVNAGSRLIVVQRPAGLTFGAGSTRSGNLTLAELDAMYTAADALTRNRVAFVLSGVGPLEFDLFTAATPLNAGNNLDARLDEIATRLKTGIDALTAANSITVSHTAGDAFLKATAAATGERSAIHFINASRNDGVATLRLSLARGAAETDGAGAVRPAATGTMATLPAGAIAALTAANGAIAVNVMHGNDTNPLNATPLVLNLWGAGTGTPAAHPPTSEGELLSQLRAALTRSTSPLLAGATATLSGRWLRLSPGPGNPNNWFAVANDGADTTAATLGFTATNIENLARYAPGSGAIRFAQLVTQLGSNGTPPLPSDLTGSQASKTGMYLLEDVDSFNLLVMPDATVGTGLMGVLTEAIAYCVRRRAMMIVDVPDAYVDFDQAQAWIESTAAPLRSRNSALYFPRLREPDPLMNNLVRSFPAAGALAGLYARTDADRGVWKAPAGTTATLVGATGLSYTLTDGQNGTLNPKGLNCLRTFPVIGTISWGARTGNGADVLADEYKYIPVRRLALYLEESLYRGTQWVVFEPNDEPLWAQIRLNIGAFMHTLYAKGAFQGRTPRDAYFVKCDSETTTQNDIDLGRVNIVVGFAPLKPAEFVIVRIQQIAGAILT
jgi:phage tail sheath protein FI